MALCTGVSCMSKWLVLVCVYVHGVTICSMVGCGLSHRCMRVSLCLVMCAWHVRCHVRCVHCARFWWLLSAVLCVDVHCWVVWRGVWLVWVFDAGRGLCGGWPGSFGWVLCDGGGDIPHGLIMLGIWWAVDLTAGDCVRVMVDRLVGRQVGMEEEHDDRESKRVVAR